MNALKILHFFQIEILFLLRFLFKNHQHYLYENLSRNLCSKHNLKLWTPQHSFKVYFLILLKIFEWLPEATKIFPHSYTFFHFTWHHMCHIVRFLITFVSFIKSQEKIFSKMSHNFTNTQGNTLLLKSN